MNPRTNAIIDALLSLVLRRHPGYITGLLWGSVKSAFNISIGKRREIATICIGRRIRMGIRQVGHERDSADFLYRIFHDVRNSLNYHSFVKPMARNMICATECTRRKGKGYIKHCC